MPIYSHSQLSIYEDCPLKYKLRYRDNIKRELEGIGGLEAVWLWWRYRNQGDKNALALLLQYNKEDVVNLKTLRERLAGCQAWPD